jgi:hypothetical protein
LAQLFDPFFLLFDQFLLLPSEITELLLKFDLLLLAVVCDFFFHVWSS